MWITGRPCEEGNRLLACFKIIHLIGFCEVDIWDVAMRSILNPVDLLREFPNQTFNLYSKGAQCRKPNHFLGVMLMKRAI